MGYGRVLYKTNVRRRHHSGSHKGHASDARQTESGYFIQRVGAVLLEVVGGVCRCSHDIT